MVCGNHLKTKYARFVIKYHLYIFSWILIMSSISMTLLVYKHDRIHYENLFQGFQAYGTTSSDNYRKLIALIRETQTGHLFPHTTENQGFQQTPYSSFDPHISPCSKRLYLSTCPILSYTELVFAFNNHSMSLFDDLDTFKSVCQLEWNLRMKFTNCSSETHHTCCQYVGPVDLLFNGKFLSSSQCDNLTFEQLDEYQQDWLYCNSSQCSNHRLHDYLKHTQTSALFTIYLSIDKNSSVIDLYNDLHRYQFEEKISLHEMKFDTNGEQLIFNHLFQSNLPLIYLTISLYMLCLLFFLKNLFFLLIISLHIFITLTYTFLIYVYLFHFPLTILILTSLTLYFYLILIDSFLWYTCWGVNQHRRDDCTINRIIENLLTQIFYYLVPKNLAAITILVLTYTNQIITLQCFTVFSFLLLLISFVISFILYPVSFVFILRYQSSILTIERFLHRFLPTSNTISCFIDRTLPCLIVRLRAVWLTLLTGITCAAFVILFHWPKQQYNICRITFDTLPHHGTNGNCLQNSQTLDIDITYYIGSRWEMPTESMIPSRDIPLLNYNSENSLTARPGTLQTFEYALEQNLTQWVDFCSRLSSLVQQKPLSYRHYHRHIRPQFEQSTTTSTLQNRSINSTLTINSLRCFGDLSSSSSANSILRTTFSPVISNQSSSCPQQCLLNQSLTSYKCILCLNSNYYDANKANDLFLIKNGLRFVSDSQYPRYLLQTITYRWNISRHLNRFLDWKLLHEALRNHFIVKFYANTFPHMSVWWSSEIFSTSAILEQLEQERTVLILLKFLVILLLLLLFTGVVGIFATLTTFFNFATCIAVFTLLDYKLTVENISHFTVVLIISSQYSILYSISYKLAPTLFFQRENRAIYSVKQLCTTLFHLTLSIVIIFSACLSSSLPYLSKSAMIYIVSSLISLIYSSFFLQSLLCYMGPSGHKCSLLPWRLKLTRHLNIHTNSNNDFSLRKSSTYSRRHHHHRMSTSSYFASSYFSQMFTGSTYFESEYGGINDLPVMSSRRRESSRSHKLSHALKKNSLLTGELIELYTPRASLAPHGYHHRSTRQSSVPRGVPTTGLARPLYVSSSISPHSQSSIHSQLVVRQRSPSPHIYRPSRSPSPHSYIRLSSSSTTAGSLRPCNSAPRLHAPMHRIQTNSIIQTDTLQEETVGLSVQPKKKSVAVIQRQNALSITDGYEQLSAANKRSILKESTTESTASLWLKRSNSS